MLYPIVWMISSSFKPSNTIFTDIGIIPRKITFENYINGWKGISGITYGRFFINSFIMVFFAIVGNLLSCSLTAYTFARLRFRGRSVLFGFSIMTMMLPIHVMVIPQFVIFSKLHWTNSILPIVVPKFFATDAYFVFLMVQFIRGINNSLDEAATIDGCSRFGVFMRVILPLMTPVIITTIIFTFLWTWNNLFNQMLYINRTENLTVTLALRMFLDAEESEFGNLFAMSTLAVLPILFVFIFLQKYLVEGISTSGMKN